MRPIPIAPIGIGQLDDKPVFRHRPCSPSTELPRPSLVSGRTTIPIAAKTVESRRTLRRAQRLDGARLWSGALFALHRSRWRKSKDDGATPPRAPYLGPQF